MASRTIGTLGTLGTLRAKDTRPKRCHVWFASRCPLLDFPASEVIQHEFTDILNVPSVPGVPSVPSVPSVPVVPSTNLDVEHGRPFLLHM